MTRKKQTPVYPKAVLTPNAYTGLPASIIAELKNAEAVYMLAGPNINGLVLISTSPDGKAGLTTMVNDSNIKLL